MFFMFSALSGGQPFAFLHYQKFVGCMGWDGMGWGPFVLLLLV